MSQNSGKRSELLAAMSHEFRQLSMANILFHQAVADRLGMHVTEHKCAEILLGTGPITAGELAQRTGLTTGAVTGVIDRLEKAGFAQRAKDPNDRRRVVIEPSPERMKKEIEPLFESIGTAMADLCGQYNAQELVLIRDFLSRFNERVYEETRKLREEDGQPKQPRGSKSIASESPQSASPRPAASAKMAER